MMNKKLHTPHGVKDYLPAEYYLKSESQRAIEAVFMRYGYSRLSAPTYEYAEVFDGCGAASAYKFVGSGGAVLVLRPDMTPSIARIAATAYKDEEIPLRFCYFEKAFRHNHSYQGKLNEFTQAGVELIGVGGHDADAEVVAAAVHSLLACEVRNFFVYIGHAGFLDGVLDEAGLDDGEKIRMKAALEAKDYVSVGQIADKAGVPDGIMAIFKEYPFLIGGVEMLEQSRGLVSSKVALEALAELESVRRILSCYGVEEHVAFDLSLNSSLDYYTGIIFRGYADGASAPVIDGGRYDGLTEKFGVSYPAVGFAIEMDMLLTALNHQKKIVPQPSTATLLAYAEDGAEMALKTASAMRRQGVVIENSLLCGGLDENVAYAKKRGFGGVLYFENSVNALVIDVETGETKEVKIAELTGGVL